mgnify:CR=1 FL=1
MSEFYKPIRDLTSGNGITILGTIEKLYAVREVPEPNRIKIKSKSDGTCFYCAKKFFEGDWIKWAMGFNEVLHLDCESQYEREHGQTREQNKIRDADFKDDTGTIKLTLWKKDTCRFSVGDKIIVQDGYVYNFNKELHISAGYYGNLSETQKTRGRNYYQEQQQRQEYEEKQREEQQQRQEYEEKQREEQQQRQEQKQKSTSDLEKYYKILELDSSANWKQVKSAYRRLALKYHPDKNKSPDSESQFKKIKNAYDKLKEKHRKDNKNE